MIGNWLKNNNCLHNRQSFKKHHSGVQTLQGSLSFLFPSIIFSFPSKMNPWSRNQLHNHPVMMSLCSLQMMNKPEKTRLFSLNVLLVSRWRKRWQIYSDISWNEFWFACFLFTVIEGAQTDSSSCDAQPWKHQSAAACMQPQPQRADSEQSAWLSRLWSPFSQNTLRPSLISSLTNVTQTERERLLVDKSSIWISGLRSTTREILVKSSDGSRPEKEPGEPWRSIFTHQRRHHTCT